MVLRIGGSMAKKKPPVADEPQGGENYPTHLEQGEAPDTDARLHGDDSLPAEPPVVDGTEPDEAQQPLPETQLPPKEAADTRAPVSIQIRTVGLSRPAVDNFVEGLREQGLHAEVVEHPSPADFGEPGQTVTYVDGHAQAVNQTRAWHEGFEDALRKYAHNVDGTEFIGTRGITLAEALEANNQRLQAKLDGLYGEQKPAEEPATV